MIAASATFAIASLDGGPVYVEGEEVERVRVSAMSNGVSRLAYVTRSGREVVIAE
jgi:hypothetical protein